jgi:hypothetical protein
VELYTGLRSDFPQMTTFSYPDYLDIRARVGAFDGVAGSGYVRGILSAGTQPQLVMGETVTPNYFDVLGIGMERGRGFGAGEDTPPMGAPVVVLSHGLWQRRFGGSAEAIGSSIRSARDALDVREGAARRRPHRRRSACTDRRRVRAASIRIPE